MSRLYLILILLLAGNPVLARVDTLRGVAGIEDATIYGYLSCDPEQNGENCRRYNAGGTMKLKVGTSGIDDHRAVLRFPGWDGELPDSSILELYCMEALDQASRRIFIYPLTRPFIEGSESFGDVGGYPVPDSGVTWVHARLDVGDLDSFPWTNPGGDYSTAAACTVTVAATGQCRIRPFNRILTWWLTFSAEPGIVLINQNVFPGNTSMRTFTASEGEASQAPRLLLYYSDDPAERNGRRLKMLTGTRE